MSCKHNFHSDKLLGYLKGYDKSALASGEAVKAMMNAKKWGDPRLWEATKPTADDLNESLWLRTSLRGGSGGGVAMLGENGASLGGFFQIGTAKGGMVEVYGIDRAYGGDVQDNAVRSLLGKGNDTITVLTGFHGDKNGRVTGASYLAELDAEAYQSKEWGGRVNVVNMTEYFDAYGTLIPGKENWSQGLSGTVVCAWCSSSKTPFILQWLDGAQ